MEPVRALYFTDVLCVWAYLNQVRIDELRAKLEEHVSVESRFCSVFGNVPGKLEEKWSQRGGAAAYGAFVRKLAAEYGHAPVHADVWSKLTPVSSMPCHLMLCAVRRLVDRGEAPAESYYAACWAVRQAFFRDARNVSDTQVLLDIAAQLGLDVDAIRAELRTGRAHAELSADVELVRQLDVKLSPSLILNEGRQRLNGNVGFRVIEANIRELMHKRERDEASWC
jgi:predicted DsbA family dithiol-disulfide isomerase